MKDMGAYRSVISVAFLAIVYMVGMVGMQGSSAGWFISLTPVTLLLSALVLTVNERVFSLKYLGLAASVFLLGFWVEYFGVQTGLIFGQYRYGSTLGLAWSGIPWVIGLNWWIMVVCTGGLAQSWAKGLLGRSLLGAAMMTLIDVLIEPVAIAQGYWSWEQSVPPIQNYVGWFGVSFVMHLVFHAVHPRQENPVSNYLLGLQILFFIVLNITIMGGTSILINALIVAGTFWFMEFMAWFTHRFLMHGLLWYLHKDHHQKEPGFFEKNDSFFLIFAIPSWLLIMFGMMNGNDFRVWIGAGIALYGFAYFLVHEVIIHQRFKWFRRSDNIYLRAIRKAHKVHHKHLGKEHGECFGMLIVPLKYYREARQSMAQPPSPAHE